MIAPLLLLLAAAPLAAQDASQADVNRLQNEVQRLANEVSRTQALVQSELRPMCTSEARFQGSGDLRITTEDSPIRMNVFGIVSNPADTCLPAEIRISATYFDGAGNFVCGGSTSVLQTIAVQNTTFEFRPYQLEVFIRWWDGPTLRQQPLTCKDYQGTELRNPADYAAAIKVWATVAPKRGGLSTAEIQIPLPRPPRR
jgi:hypothetical protein